MKVHSDDEVWKCADDLWEAAAEAAAADELDKWNYDIKTFFDPNAEEPDPDDYAADYTWVVKAFGKFLVPHPDELAKLGELLGKAIDPTTGLASADRHLGYLTILLRDWSSPSGGAAEAFSANYLSPMSDILDNQVKLLTSLKSAVDAECRVWVAARQDVIAVGRNAIAALHKLHFSSARDTIDQAYKDFVTSAKPVTSTVKLVKPGTSPIDRVGAAVELIDFADDEWKGKDRIPIDDDKVEAIMDSVRSSLDTLTKNIDHLEQSIIGSLDRITTAWEKNRTTLLGLKVPELVNLPDDRIDTEFPAPAE